MCKDSCLILFVHSNPLTRNKANCWRPSAFMSSPADKEDAELSPVAHPAGSLPTRAWPLTHTPGEVGSMLCLVGAQHGHTPVLLHLPAAVDGGCEGTETPVSTTGRAGLAGPSLQEPSPSSSWEEASSHCRTTRRPSSAITLGYLQEPDGCRSGWIRATPGGKAPKFLPPSWLHTVLFLHLILTGTAGASAGGRCLGWT